MIIEKLQVPTPTKEEYKEVVQCMLDNGHVWRSGYTDVCEDIWNYYGKKTNICLGYLGIYDIFCGRYLEPDHKTYTTKEFLDKYGKKEEEIKINIMAPYNDIEYYFLSSQDLVNPIIQTQKDYKLDNKTMNIKKFVKTLTLSKEDKLLREQGLQNDCGDFTEEARELVINKLVEENKDYLVEIATKLKEEDKE